MDNQTNAQQTTEEFVASVNKLYDITASETQNPIPFWALPQKLVLQLRQDGARDGLRTLPEAERVYNALPDNVRADLNAIQDVVDSPDFEWGHHTPYSLGGSDAAANGSYMPADLNRSISDNHPTNDQLTEAYEAVEAQGYATGSFLLDTVVDSAAAVVAPAGVMAIGTGLKALGSAIRHDQAAIDAARKELPNALKQGVKTGVTRCLPAQIGGAMLGPVGAVAGFAAKDIYTACDSGASAKDRRNAAIKTAAVAGGAILLNGTPIGWMALASYGAAKFLGFA
jgi:hypothetical protein